MEGWVVGNVALLVLIIDKIKELPAREASTAALLMSGIVISMRHRLAHRGAWHFSDRLKEFGRRIEEADGIVPLKPGMTRPPGYYMAGFWTMGRKPIDMSKPAPPPDSNDDRR